MPRLYHRPAHEGEYFGAGADRVAILVQCRVSVAWLQLFSGLSPLSRTCALGWFDSRYGDSGLSLFPSGN